MINFLITHLNPTHPRIKQKQKSGPLTIQVYYRPLKRSTTPEPVCCQQQIRKGALSQADPALQQDTQLGRWRAVWFNLLFPTQAALCSPQPVQHPVAFPPRLSPQSLFFKASLESSISTHLGPMVSLVTFAFSGCGCKVGKGARLPCQQLGSWCSFTSCFDSLTISTSCLRPVP